MSQRPGDERTSTRSSKSERTRLRILDAAEKNFGAQGFHGASIVDITKDAGVALGTFYLYFPSKIDVFRQLLRARRDELRRGARDSVEGLEDHRAIVEAAFGAFFSWVADHASIYRVIREAEFVDASLIDDLYRNPVKDQIDGLARAMNAEWVERDDPEVLAWCLAGMAEFTALRWIVWTDGGHIPTERFQSFVNAVLRMVGSR
jgi:AcrR family transcriptional regulator